MQVWEQIQEIRIFNDKGVCGIGTLPCSVLPRTPCSCSCGSKILWGWHTFSRTLLRCLVPLVMLLMTQYSTSSSVLAAG